MSLYNVDDSLNYWLEELKLSTEVECLSILQGKSIVKNNFQGKLYKKEILYLNLELLHLYTSIREIQEKIDVQNGTSYISDLLSIVDKSKEFLIYVKNLMKKCDNFENIKKIDIGCIRLRSLIECISIFSKEKISTELYEYLDVIKLSISELRNDIVSFLIKEFITNWLIRDNVIQLSTLNDIYCLITNSPYFISFLIANDIFKKVLEVIKKTNNSDLQIVCLLIIIGLCNSKENLQKFDNENGFQHISLLFCNNQHSDELSLECVKLLSLMFASDNYIDKEYNGYLENIQDIIISLLDFTFNTNYDYIKLLNGLVAILNLLNHDEICLDIMCEQNFLQRLSDYTCYSKDFNVDIISKFLEILELLSYNETAFEEIIKEDLMQNMLISNLKYLILNTDIPESLYLYILTSTLKILNKYLRRSSNLKLQFMELKGVLILHELAKCDPKLNKNIDFINIIEITTCN